MNIIETLIRIKDGVTTTAVMTQGAIEDVAVYRVEDDAPLRPEFVARFGFKLSEREAISIGFTIPEGTHYRR